MREFSTIEESVLHQWAAAQDTGDTQAAASMYETCAAEWSKAITIAREVESYKLPDNMHAFTVHLVDYCEKRGALLSLLQQVGAMPAPAQ